MMKYKILTGGSAKELEEKVNSEIKAGWEPLGGLICGISATNQMALMQSMINREPAILQMR